MNAQKNMLREVLNCHADAITFIEDLSTVSQVWDDLIDCKQPTRQDINAAFICALSYIPRNKFYLNNINTLQPFIEQVICDWLTANDFEKGDVTQKSVAYTLRDSLASVVVQCASILGGIDWAIKVSPIIRSFYHDEPIENYLREHASG